MRRTFLIGAVVITAAALLAACGETGGGGSGGSTIKVGVLTSLSGSYASGFTTTEKGVKARFDLENAAGGVNGKKLEYVMADDANGADVAVNKLVQQEKVFGILSVSPLFVRGATAAARSGVPVFGSGFDGAPQWLDKNVKNFFDIAGAAGYGAVNTNFGAFAKSQGVTRMAGVGNSGSPSSAGAATGVVMSAEHAGIPRGYLSTTLAPGSTDVGPAVLGIKESGSDGLYLPVIPATAFALIAGLAQAGVPMKAIILATGYGNDLLESPPAVQAGQGVDFMSGAAPVELKTPGTLRFQDALQRYAGVTGTPTFAEYQGWLTADAFIAGLKAAGPNPTTSGYVQKFRNSDWDTAGLLGTPENHTLNFGDYGGAGAKNGPNNCFYVVKLKGKQFEPIPGASPVCGELVPGLSTGF
ncbi:MAG TPA: ABC transporter substrate-binding protein [Amycolatopsis sp.]|nr:ABC transporter substrate-binding protein [Amycolatopsis sp.]